MAKLTTGHRRAILAAVAVIAAGGALASSSLRASCSAAWIAFRDPSRVRGDDGAPLAPSPAAPPLELDQPEISSDFDRAGDADLADGGSLLLPDLPIPLSQRTMRFAAWFAADPKGRQAFAERFRRAGRYRAHVEQALRDAELPEDALWLVAIVSGFEPQATSPKGAAGLFQFMPETAARFGLAQTEWIDERRSIPKSTQAGAALLRQLHDRYGQWDLALAAYNMGHENLDEALEKLRKRRNPREAQKPIELKDLADARLVPKETANFVPQVQAFALVAANRGRFGLDDLDAAPPFELAELAVPPETPLRLVARAAGISLATLRDYNPDLLKDRTPPGTTDVIVQVPADRIATALTALPVLLAREAVRLAASAAASASAAPIASAAEPTASASASAAAAPPPPVDRFTVAGGVIIERRPSASTELTVSARVEVMDASRAAARPTGEAFDTPAVTARAGDLAGAFARTADAVRRTAAGSGEAATAARRRAGAARRQALEKAAYGSAWLALGDRLFAQGGPLAGAVLFTPTMPLQAVCISEPGWASPAFQAAVRVIVTVSGPSDPAAVAAAAERAFAVAPAQGAAPSPLAREERVDLSENVPSPRAVFGWLVPTPSEADRAAIRLVALALAHEQHGRVARALLTETHVAVRVRGLLDVGDAASVLAIEAAPSVLHDVAAVERELDRALAAFAARGPTEPELSSAKEQLRARIAAARSRAGTNGEAKEPALARLARAAEPIEGVSGEDLRALVERSLSKDKRAVVVTSPRR